MIAFFSGVPGPIEILLILVVIMLLFGAKRLPALARSLGRSLSEFKRGKEDGQRELDENGSAASDASKEKTEDKSSSAITDH